VYWRLSYRSSEKQNQHAYRTIFEEKANLIDLTDDHTYCYLWRLVAKRIGSLNIDVIEYLNKLFVVKTRKCDIYAKKHSIPHWNLKLRFIEEIITQEFVPHKMSQDSMITYMEIKGYPRSFLTINMRELTKKCYYCRK
jgi:hypothetical protein